MEEEFQQILEANKHKIYRICRIYALAPLEPKDLFQEVVFQLWKSFASFQGKSSRSTWVYKVALNVCLRTKLKWQKKRDKVLPLDVVQFRLMDTTIETEEQAEKYEALRSCITRLNEADQSVVVLFLEGLAYKEIALISGLTENHVAVKMKRIRQRLLNCMTPKLN